MRIPRVGDLIQTAEDPIWCNCNNDPDCCGDHKYVITEIIEWSNMDGRNASESPRLLLLIRRPGDNQPPGYSEDIWASEEGRFWKYMEPEIK
jgi:hypothetical protein